MYATIFREMYYLAIFPVLGAEIISALRGFALETLPGNVHLHTPLRSFPPPPPHYLQSSLLPFLFKSFA